MATPKLNRKNATADKSAATAQLKQFRKDLASLKRKGLVDHKYDARSQVPTKYLKSQLKRFADVLSGDKGAVKVRDKKKRAAYKAQGYEVKGDRVLVKKAPGETVRAKKGANGLPDFAHVVKGDGGSISKMNMRLNRTDIRKWIVDLRNNRVKVSDDEELMFQIFGNNSREGFGTFGGKTAQERMADYLEFNYPVIDEVEGDPDKEKELIQDIVIYKIHRTKRHVFNYPKPQNREERMSDEYRRRARERSTRARERRMGRMTEKRSLEYLEAKAEIARENRANFQKTASPERIEARKADARARAKKSRENKIKK